MEDEPTICRKLFWQYIAGEITNDFLQAELKRLFGNQQKLDFKGEV